MGAWVQNFCGVMGLFIGAHRPMFNDFLKTKKMRNVRTIILAAVSRQDLYYVSENESFCSLTRDPLKDL